MKILITGPSGRIGQALTKKLTSAGHTIHGLKRGSSFCDNFHWQPESNLIHIDDSAKLDVVIHLAGANIADKRWSKTKRPDPHKSYNRNSFNRKRNSQPQTQTPLFLSGSAIGYYGETGNNAVNEQNNPGTGFLPEVCQEWENAAQPAINAGIKTLHLRTGIVLSPEGGALNKMLPPFRLGLGGKTGNGNQYMSWTSLADITNMILLLIENQTIEGPVNLVSTNAVTNTEFTKTLAKVLNKPTFFTAPAFVLRLLLGEMADALLLSSTRVVPQKLIDSNYKFIDEDLEKTLNRMLNTNQTRKG